jgi:hypothetical protein
MGRVGSTRKKELVEVYRNMGKHDMDSSIEALREIARDGML